jgi:amino acid transporter
MKRIFTTMAALNALLLLAAFGLGLVFMRERQASLGAPTGHEPLGLNRFTGHKVLSLVAALFTLLVHCLIFTYFLGTGRWVKEVARAYALPDAELPKQTREFKRTVFPPALFAMLSTIAAVASGAGAQTSIDSLWSLSHPVLTVLAMLINAYAYVVEYRIVSLNSAAMDRVMEEVGKRRALEKKT